MAVLLKLMKILIRLYKSFLQNILRKIVVDNNSSDMSIQPALISIHHQADSFFTGFLARHQPDNFFFLYLH